ncbi:MAG: cupredoxin family copper-binding protein [Candidatus Acidiferrales bacterium]
MRHQTMQRTNAARIFGTAICAATLFSLPLASRPLRLDPVAAAEAKPNATAITIDNFNFAPMQLEIAAGTQVTWINKDDVPHTVVSVDHKFKSRALDTDESFSFTFKDPGTYEYFCSVHPKMTGKIVVK